MRTEADLVDEVFPSELDLGVRYDATLYFADGATARLGKLTEEQREQLEGLTWALQAHGCLVAILFEWEGGRDGKPSN